MKYIFGNWKMYLDYEKSLELARGLALERFDFKKINLVVFPTALVLPELNNIFKNTGVGIGAQNVAGFPMGAYTGGISALMYQDVGCKYALVGHSERRHVFGEDDNQIRKQIEACLEVGLIPVVCIGETREEKENNKREYRLKKQLMKAFEGLNYGNNEIMVAYEPVWAIGTGEACNPADADDVQGWIKLELKNYFAKDIAVLYGGSVNSENVLSYLTLNTVDGVLAGGASTKLDTFTQLIKIAEKYV